MTRSSHPLRVTAVLTICPLGDGCDACFTNATKSVRENTGQSIAQARAQPAHRLPRTPTTAK
jgi:hypothetical protein